MRSRFPADRYFHGAGQCRWRRSQTPGQRPFDRWRSRCIERRRQGHMRALAARADHLIDHRTVDLKRERARAQAERRSTLSSTPSGWRSLASKSSPGGHGGSPRRSRRHCRRKCVAESTPSASLCASRLDQSTEHRRTSASTSPQPSYSPAIAYLFGMSQGSMSLGAQEMHQTSVHHHM
jgi:hypothetical protein